MRLLFTTLMLLSLHPTQISATQVVLDDGSVLKGRMEASTTDFAADRVAETIAELHLYYVDGVDVPLDLLQNSPNC